MLPIEKNCFFITSIDSDRSDDDDDDEDDDVGYYYDNNNVNINEDNDATKELWQRKAIVRRMEKYVQQTILPIRLQSTVQRPDYAHTFKRSNSF